MPTLPTCTPTRRQALGLLAIGGMATLAGCASDDGAATAEAASPAPTIAPGARTTARGAFEGRSDHITTGHARVIFSQGEVIIALEEDFTFDGAPDPKVGLGNGGFDASTILSPLRSNSGAQTYALKAGLDIGDYTEVWIWCQKFSVPLGVAKLTLT